MSKKEREQAYLLNLFESPYAKELKERIALQDIANAENEASQLLKGIEDTELKFNADTAIGKIAAAYEKLGFLCGYKAHQSGV